MSSKGLACALIMPVLLFFISDLFAQQATVIRWGNVYGAGGYFIEIRNSQKKMVVEKELPGTSFDVSMLPAGRYEYRITTLNKLKRKGNSTGWIALTIEKALIPSITKISGKFFSHSYDNPPITVTGSNFLSDTRLYLKNEKGMMELGTVYVSSAELKALFKSDKKITGIYDLVAVNRGGFEAVMPSAVEITDPDIPLVESLSVSKIYAAVETELIIRGKNLGKETVPVIENESGNRINFSRLKTSSEEITISVKPEAGTGGIYKITALKRNYFLSASKLQLEVMEPDIPVLESLSENSVYQSIDTELAVSGKNLGGNIKIQGVNSSGDKLDIVQKQVSESKIHVSIRPGPGQSGEYTITAVKHGLFSSKTGLKLMVIPPEVIKILSVNPSEISIAKGGFTVTVTGENINEKTLFELRGTRAILKPLHVSGDGKSINLYFEEKSFKGGDYSLFCENKPFKPVNVDKAVTVHDTSGGLLGFNVLTAGVGLEYNIPSGDWSGKLEPSLTGFHLYISYPLARMLSFLYVPVLKNCGMEFFAGYAAYEFKKGTPDDSFTKTFLYAGLNYPFNLSFIDYNLSLILNADAGMVYSSMSYIYDDEHKDYSSTDPALKGGITLRYEWLNYFFTDLSMEYSRIFFVSHPLDEIKISLGIGIKL
jgi:hypothetical protein